MTSDSTVVPLRQPDAIDDPLTAILRSGARRLLAAGDRGGSRGVPGNDEGRCNCRTGVSASCGTGWARNAWFRPGSARSRCGG